MKPKRSVCKKCEHYASPNEAYGYFGIKRALCMNNEDDHFREMAFSSEAFEMPQSCPYLLECLMENHK